MMPIINTIYITTNTTAYSYYRLSFTTTTINSAGIGTFMFQNPAISFNYKQLNNVIDPTTPQQVATKNYTDVNISNSAATKLSINGRNSMTGALNFDNKKGIDCSNTSNAQDVSTKNYTDVAVAPLSEQVSEAEA